MHANDLSKIALNKKISEKINNKKYQKKQQKEKKNIISELVKK